MRTVTIVVEGLVQGVFYRQSTKAWAIENGISGEVRNKPDGTVQIIATGTPEQLRDLIEWCKQGPEHAVVTDVKVEEMKLQKFRTFNIVRN